MPKARKFLSDALANKQNQSAWSEYRQNRFKRAPSKGRSSRTGTPSKGQVPQTDKVPTAPNTNKKPLAGAPGSKASPPTFRRRVKPFEDLLKELCEERGESYSDVLAALGNRRCVTKSDLVDSAHYAKDGRVWKEVQQQLQKAKKALTQMNMIETARVLEELCLPGL